MHSVLPALCLAALLFGVSPALARQRYLIDVTLDPTTHQLIGKQTIEFSNTSTEKLSKLHLHLYLNAFKDRKSLFFRDAHKRGRSGTTPEQWGSQTIESIHYQGHELWHKRQRVLAEDDTDFALPLPTLLAPGQDATLHLKWTATLPSLTERTGFSDTFHLLGQWFPKLAVLSNDGNWQHSPFHPHQEFFSEFADYDVSITVPQGFIVGATGQRLSASSQEGSRTLRYAATQVVDFAWTAWTHFEESEHQLPGVRVRLLMPPQHELNRSTTLQAVRKGLARYASDYGPYPYSHLTVVAPPRSAAATAGGMEYPQFITTGAAWFSPLLDRQVEHVTLHELAHQWFQTLIATNESLHPWLDEGLSSYAELRVTEELFGAGSALDFAGIQVSTTAVMRASAARWSGTYPLQTPARDFGAFADIGAVAYAQSATLLESIARSYSRREVVTALNRYALRHRFEHPGPSQFLGSFREAPPAILAALETALKKPIDLDNSVRAIHSRKSVVGGEPLPSASAFTSRVELQRDGTLPLPVDVQLIDDRGTVFEQRLPPDTRGLTQLVHQGARPIIRVVVDPELKLPSDAQLLNNSLSTVGHAPLGLGARASFWMSTLLQWLGP